MNSNNLNLSKNDLLEIISINKLINSEINFEKVMNTIVQIACDAMNSSLCSLMLFTRDKQYLKVAASIGIQEDIIPKIRVKVGEGISGWVAKHGESLLIKDITKDERVKITNYKKDKYSTPSCLSVPMYHKKILIGVFNINNKKDNNIYTERDRKFLESLAEQAAIAIKNAEMYNEIVEHKKALEDINLDLEESAYALSEYTEELYTLHEITKIIAQRVSSYSEWETLIQEILDIFFSIEVLCVNEISLFTTQNNAWKIELIRKIKSDLTSIDTVLVDSLDIEIKDNIIELCTISMDTDEIILIPEYDNKFENYTDKFSDICSSMMFVPLKNKNNPIGVLVINRNDKKKYNEKNRNLMNVIGLQIATALSLGRAYDEEVKTKVLDRELELAHNIQTKLLPATFPDISGIDIYGAHIPAKSIGGDYYDVLVHNDGRIGFVIADVSGKGVPAALIMTMVRSYLRSEITKGTTSCVEILNNINKLILNDIEGDRYVTMFYGILNTSDLTFEYAKAGHNPPIIIHSNGSVDVLDGRGLFIGMFENGLYEKHIVKLKKGDKIFLYTDGITEAMNLDFEEFGVERLKNILKNTRDKVSRAISENIYREVEKFTENAPQHDDMTVLLFGINDDTEDIFDHIYSSKRENIKKFLEVLVDKMDKYGIKDTSVRFTIKLVYDELLCNSMEHGNKFDENKNVHVYGVFSNKFVEISFEDEGKGFDWRKSNDSRSNVLSERGRGIKVCKRAVDVLKYNSKGNKVTAKIFWNKKNRGIL